MKFPIRVSQVLPDKILEEEVKCVSREALDRKERRREEVSFSLFLSFLFIDCTMRCLIFLIHKTLSVGGAQLRHVFGSVPPPAAFPLLCGRPAKSGESYFYTAFLTPVK